MRVAMRSSPTALALAGAVAVLCGACGPPGGPAASGTAAAGMQHVAYYRASQVHSAERTLGYAVVEPVGAVRLTTGLGLTLVAVTQLTGGPRAIHYVFGDTHLKWVMIMETPASVTPYRYDAGGQTVFFAARGRGLSVSTNLPRPTLDRIVHSLGGPAKPPTS